jgi:plastocyanin
MMLAPVLTPPEFYSGFNGGFRQPDLTRPGGWQSTFFGNEQLATDEPNVPCGRVVHDACVFSYTEGAVEFGINSSVMVNPPPNGGDGNTVFTVILDPSLPLGPYYAMSLADGPTMSMRIDLVAPDQPVQAAGEVRAAAERQYEDDLAWLAGLDRVSSPAEASNPDGTKTWQVAAGLSGQNKPWLAVNEFAPAQMMIRAGDTVTWTNQGPGVAIHTVTGFAATADEIPELSPYQPGCMTSSGDLALPPPGTFPPDIWNTCAGSEVNNFTEFSQPSAPSGDPYVDGSRTSGILLNEEYRNSPIGDGLPYASSYSVTFPEAGTYHYHCAIHPGMEGTVIVIPKPMPL